MPAARHQRRHLLLAGMMGAGKSTLGPEVARLLGWPFVDLDTVVARRAGRPVAELLADQGEGAFRRREAQCLAALLADEQPTVVALGGGTLATAAARRTAARRAATLHLTARPHNLARRLFAVRAGRPLLGQPASLAALGERLAALARARQAHWHACDGRLAVDRGSVPDLAEAAAQWARQQLPGACRRLLVAAAAGPYPVLIDDLGPRRLAACLAARASGARLAVVTCPVVAARWGTTLVAALRSAGARAGLVVVPAAGAAKRWAVAGHVIEQLLAGGWERGDRVVALGGGSVGDLAGFVASILLRGGPLWALPTTILAAVDASVGGKNGLDAAGVKNQIGTFWPPEAVWVDWRMLASEPAAGRAGGWAEALKMAIALDAGLFGALAANPAAMLAGDFSAAAVLMARAIALKARVVAEDERDQGSRAVLNLGHTIGHAIEAVGGVAHGQAVAWGLLAEAALMAAVAAGPPALEGWLRTPLAALNLSTDWRRAKIDVAALAQDKKRRSGQLTMPMVVAPGHWRPAVVPLAQVAAFCARHMVVAGRQRARRR